MASIDKIGSTTMNVTKICSSIPTNFWNFWDHSDIPLKALNISKNFLWFHEYINKFHKSLGFSDELYLTKTLLRQMPWKFLGTFANTPTSSLKFQYYYEEFHDNPEISQNSANWIINFSSIPTNSANLYEVSNKCL